MGQYTGMLTTYATTPLTTLGDIRDIKAVTDEVAKAAGIHKNVIKVLPNRDIAVEYFWITGTFPNLFLPDEYRTEENETSFDGILSYLFYRLDKAGYPYHGEIFFNGSVQQWKLRVKGGEVFRSEGAWRVVYDNDNEFQVGGMEF